MAKKIYEFMVIIKSEADDLTPQIIKRALEDSDEMILIDPDISVMRIGIK